MEISISKRFYKKVQPRYDQPKNSMSFLRRLIFRCRLLLKQMILHYKRPFRPLGPLGPFVPLSLCPFAPLSFLQYGPKNFIPWKFWPVSDQLN